MRLHRSILTQTFKNFCKIKQLLNIEQNPQYSKWKNLFLNAPQRVLLDKIFRNEKINQKEDYEIIENILPKINVNNLSLSHLHSLVIFLSESRIKRISFHKVFKAMIIFGNRIEELTAIKDSNVTRESFLSLTQLIIALTNLNLNSKMLMKKFMNFYFLPHFPAFMEQEDIALRFPNILWAYVKVNYQFDESEIKKLVVIISSYLQNSKCKLFILKRVNLWWALVISGLDKKIAPEIAGPFFKRLFLGMNANGGNTYNLKAAISFLEIMLIMTPELGYDVKNSFFIKNSSKLKNKYCSEVKLMADVFNNCLAVLKTNNKPETDFHFLAIENQFGTILFQKQTLFEKKSGFEENVAFDLSQKGFRSVLCNSFFGLYEVDFIIDDNIVIELNGMQHYMFCKNDNQAKDKYGKTSEPHFVCSSELMAHTQLRINNLYAMGAEYVLFLNISELRQQDDDAFRLSIVQEVCRKIKEFQDSKTISQKID